jgi:single-stranded-DNA-specific exonuclease
VTPEFFALLQKMEPFGVGNPQPVFSARNLQLTAPPRIIKEKHMRLRVAERTASDSVPKLGALGWRKSVSFDAMGWRMAQLLQSSPLIAGDNLEIAFTLGQNEHPDFGGLELTLKDFRSTQMAAT